MRISDWSSDVCSSDLIGALVQGARIDAREGERTDERVVHDLEGEQRQRRRVRRLARIGLIIVGIDALNGRNVERRRQIVDDRVEQDRKSVVSGKSVSVRVDLGGRGTIKKKQRSKNKI